MSQNISIEHTVVTLNGHKCEGWANVADAIQLPDVDLSQTETGPDGLDVTSSTGMRGGEVVFKFQANSRTRAFLGNQVAQIQKGANIVFEGSISNSQTGETTRLERGKIQTAPLGTTLGNAIPPPREFTFKFESILSSYDGFKSQAAPTVAESFTPAAAG